MFGLLSLALEGVKWLILARVILSWVPQWQDNPVGRLIMAVTEPILAPFRAVARVGHSGVYLDLSPMIALLVIWVIQVLTPL